MNDEDLPFTTARHHASMQPRREPCCLTMGCANVVRSRPSQEAIPDGTTHSCIRRTDRAISTKRSHSSLILHNLSATWWNSGSAVTVATDETNPIPPEWQDRSETGAWKSTKRTQPCQNGRRLADAERSVNALAESSVSGRAAGQTRYVPCLQPRAVTWGIFGISRQRLVQTSRICLTSASRRDGTSPRQLRVATVQESLPIADSADDKPRSSLPPFIPGGAPMAATPADVLVRWRSRIYGTLVHEQAVPGSRRRSNDAGGGELLTVLKMRAAISPGDGPGIEGDGPPTLTTPQETSRWHPRATRGRSVGGAS